MFSNGLRIIATALVFLGNFTLEVNENLKVLVLLDQGQVRQKSPA